MKNNKKKRAIILSLLLFTIIGLAGYGVYSYYYTEGEFNGYDTISIKAFDPNTTIEGSSNFLGQGGTLKINCPDTVYTSGNESLTCTGSVIVSNNSGVDITVEVLEPSSGKYSWSKNLGDSTVSSPTFNWTSKTISGNDSDTLVISIPVNLITDFGSSDAIDAGADAEIIDATGYVTAGFKLRATQVH